MGTKNNPGAFDCYHVAGDNEPMFILLARDPLAPQLVMDWALRRERTRGPSSKVDEARACAHAMEAWALAERHTDQSDAPKGERASTNPTMSIPVRRESSAPSAPDPTPAPATPDWAEQQAAEIYQKHGSQQCPYCGAKDWSVTFGLAQHLRTSHVPATPEAQSDMVEEINAFLAGFPNGKPAAGFRFGELLQRARDALREKDAEIARLWETIRKRECEADIAIGEQDRLDAELARAKPVIEAARASSEDADDGDLSPFVQRRLMRLREAFRDFDEKEKA